MVFGFEIAGVLGGQFGKVHVHESAIVLRDTILQPGADLQLTRFGRQRQVRQLLLGNGDFVEGQQRLQG